MLSKVATVAALVAAARAQKACTLTAETHPSMTWSKCAAGGTCSTVQGSVTVDANWRWLHTTSGSTNCYSGNKFDATLCPDPKTCTANCCLDGADYAGTYGATTSGNALNLQFVTKGQYSTNIGSRLYLMESDTKYQGFTLLGNEFTFDVDVSKIGCGLNGALYFVSMDLDGGASKFSTNTAGAKYGTGYCDSQCPRDVKFIDGTANSDGWQPSSNDANAGVGSKGACCAEMDIWEANSVSSAVTPHPCTNNVYHSCTGDSCGGTYSSDRYAGDCDPDGCDFNAFRMGNKTFYGAGSGFTLDTTKPMTVVTQFLTGSDGTLSDIKRFYVQNGKTIANAQSLVAGASGNSITTSFCQGAKAAFGDNMGFFDKGGLAAMGAALAKPMVLTMSLWDDHHSNMLWLDSVDYPETLSPSAPGAARGTCATTSGVPADLEANQGSSSVKYSNIKFGPIGSTFSGGGVVTPPSSSSSTRPGVSSTMGTSTRPASSSSTTRPGVSTTTTTRSTSASPSPSSGGGTAQHWGQCGGQGWTGPTTCVAPYKCTKSNDYYSQCL